MSKSNGMSTINNNLEQNLESASLVYPDSDQSHALKYNCNWASEASPTLGCSIEISHDIYVSWFVYLPYVKMRRQKYVAKHAHAQTQFWAVKTDQ